METNHCPFCNPINIVLQNKLAVAIYDRYPVSPGHLLILTRRHVENYFATTLEERQAINDLLEEGKWLLELKYHPDGYNVGMNCGSGWGKSDSS